MSTLENYWSIESGEDVSIVKNHWPGGSEPDYELRVGGSDAGTFATLHDLEDYLDRLAVVKHEQKEGKR